MPGCQGKCYEKRWKVKPGSLTLGTSAPRVIPNENETEEAARQRCLNVGRPNDPEKRAALQTTVGQYTADVNEECTGEYCACVFPKWGPWLPEDDVDGENVTENWVDMNVEGLFERQGCKFQFWGHVKVKVRERNGICIETIMRAKYAYIPEWKLDLSDERLAILSDKSREILKEIFS